MKKKSTSEKLKEKPLKGSQKAKTPKKNSTKSSKKSTSQVKSVPRDSIYSLDTWKFKYEKTKKPRPRINVDLKKRIKHAWEVLRG